MKRFILFLMTSFAAVFMDCAQSPALIKVSSNQALMIMHERKMMENRTLALEKHQQSGIDSLSTHERESLMFIALTKRAAGLNLDDFEKVLLEEYDKELAEA